MTTLRRCHSMPLRFQKTDEGHPTLFSPIGRKRRAESMRLTSHRPADLHVGQFSAAEKPLKPIEPTSSLLLDTQQVAIGLDIHTLSSTGREFLHKLGQKPLHDSIDLNIIEETCREGQESTINNRSQSHLPQDENLPNNDFKHSDLPRRISETIQTVIRAQQKVSGMRVQLAEMRSDLDKRRTAQIFQWADHLQEIKSMLSSAPFEHTNTSSITMQLRALETINQHSDDYLLRENEYRNFQRKLEAEENSLQQRQTHIAEVLQSFTQRNYATELHMNFGSNGSYQQTQDKWPMTEDDSDTARTTESPMELHPLVEKYLAEVGEIRMYQERLGELSLEHAEITGREASFALANMSLDEGSRYFLDNYESQRLELEQMISEKMDAAASIREQCEKEGLSLPANLRAEVETEILDMDIRESLPQERDLLWVSELDENNPFSEMAQTRDFNMYNFINVWIFHQLRHSTSQICRYKSNPRLQDLDMGGDDISEWVMKLWFRDEKLKLASPLRTSIGSGSK
ncbi:hypothetical protein DPV78_003175 [Talaromyces pinophilus]|nr:hypothetical protein DPV78_003175 [Talaromyces pinophilus]